MTSSSPDSRTALDWAKPRPLDACYWVVPGRLLVGEHPASRSRAQSMERLRRFLETGVTCFIDLTEPDEMASYEVLLPFETPSGRRVEYLREPVRDHGVPANRETMGRIVALIDGALDAGHCVYVHCRAGIGRSGTAAGCWLAERNPGGGAGALEELAEYWQQCAQSSTWPEVPETAEQADFVRSWRALRPLHKGASAAKVQQSPTSSGDLDLPQRVQGAWYGLALGDALGTSDRAHSTTSLVWTQDTALALCLADSLAAMGRCDARDQMERYWSWFKQGQRSATGDPGEPTASPDVVKALTTYRWRGLPMAGSHDPKDSAETSLPRVLAAVVHAGSDAAGAVALAAECSRTTHQSPLILDSCRLYAATLACALQGRGVPASVEGVPAPAVNCWGTKPLRKDVRAACTLPNDAGATVKSATLPDVLRAVVSARRIVGTAADFNAAIAAAMRSPVAEHSVLVALVGTIFGALRGRDALPAGAIARLAGRDQLDGIVAQAMARHGAVAH